MVTKLYTYKGGWDYRLILAKNHMVTKLLLSFDTTTAMSYSSKKSYGNKTSNTCYHIFKNNKILNIL